MVRSPETPPGSHPPSSARSRRCGAPTATRSCSTATFVAELRADAADALGELGARLGDETLSVNKFNVAEVLACETHFLAPSPFAWTPAIACGKVSHKAIELHLNWRGEPTPAELVDEALARLADEESSFGDWVAALSAGDEADLRGRATARVTQFVECFPPLRHAWHPVTEAQVRWPVDGPILLRAKADIVIGRAAGAESRKVLIDLKSGRIYDRHREDLRFYALVETLAREVPPRMVASFSLEAGEAVVDDVSAGHAADVAAPHARRHRADGRAHRRGPAAAAAAERLLLPLPRARRAARSRRRVS